MDDKPPKGTDLRESEWAVAKVLADLMHCDVHAPEAVGQRALELVPKLVEALEKLSELAVNPATGIPWKTEIGAEVEQLQVQLAGCGAAAQGATRDPNVARRGDYGWSPAYQDVLDLRRKYDEFIDRRCAEQGARAIAAATVVGEKVVKGSAEVLLTAESREGWGGVGITVHVLRHGLPLCEFLREPPAAWPAGHKWVEGVDARAADCPGCVKAWSEIVRRLEELHELLAQPAEPKADT